MDPAIRSKLSPATADLVDRLGANEAISDQAVRVFVQLAAPLDPAIEQRLHDAGLSIQTRAGDVLTARARPQLLESIASIGEVRYVDLAQKMFLE